MLKKILLSLFFCLSLNADINQAVENLIGPSNYNTHKNLINHLFKNTNNFYEDDKIDYLKVTQTLSNNNILNFNYGNTDNIEIIFYYNANPKLSIINMTDILKTIGKQNFITVDEIVISNRLKWRILIKSKTNIDPFVLSKELKSANSNIVNIINHGGNKWSYYIDSINATVYKTEQLVDKDKLSLRKPIKPYIIRVKNARTLTINSSSIWHPMISFYDKDFNLLHIIKKTTSHRSILLKVPDLTMYIKINDTFTISNFRQGITIQKD